MNRVPFHQRWFECLNSHAVQSRSTVKQNRMILNHLLKDIPNLFILALEHLLGRLDRVRMPHLFEPADDKGLEQFQCDFLWQTTLVQLQTWAHHDYRSG